MSKQFKAAREFTVVCHICTNRSLDLTASEETRWFDPLLSEKGLEFSDRPGEFDRLWRAFMTARATLGLVLVALQCGIFFLAAPQSSTPLLISAAYLVVAVAVRVLTPPQQLGNTLDAQWIRTVGVDVLVFASLQMLQSNTINYAPLFALPVLMASVLGSLLMALGSAACVTLLLFAYAGWMAIHTPWDATSHFLQAALAGTGCFVISFVASQLAIRLTSIELKAQRSQLAAAIQSQVNELVIESLTEGILVVDEHHRVRAANPAAHMLLDTPDEPVRMPLDLATQPGWHSLMNLVTASFTSQGAQQKNITIHHEGQGPRQLLVHTQLTAPLDKDAAGLCVVFMQDQREMQARMRTEKLASMGRMSAAVAHEIRNPLAAIVQANALLAEDLSDPVQKRLTGMVQQNAHRLEKIVGDILNLSHSQKSNEMGRWVNLNEAIPRICRDWQNQNTHPEDMQVELPPSEHWVWFEPEYMHRILVNLLDNAHRYASHHGACIQVSADVARSPQTGVNMRVWSDSGPLEPSVEQHLFEPFFSSEIRSSGLGLYICRELCDSLDATITYHRSMHMMNGQSTDGNEFCITFKIKPTHRVNASLHVRAK